MTTALTQYLNSIERVRTGHIDAGEIADRLRAQPVAKIVYVAHVRTARARAAQLLRFLEALAAGVPASRERESAKGEGREGVLVMERPYPKGKGGQKGKSLQLNR